MNHSKFVILLYLVLIKTSLAQNEDRKFEHVKGTDQGLEVFVSDGKYDIQFYTNHIVETTFIPKGEAVKGTSHAVILRPQEINIVPVITNNESVFYTNGLEVKIQHQPFQIFYSYKGNSVISEKAGYIKNDSLETIQFNLKKDEVLYGGGARALGMNRRGNRLQLYNKADYGYEIQSELMNFTLPIVMSSNKYMVHFDNAPIGFLDLDSKKDNTLNYETVSGRKTYQIIVGDTWYDIINNYTKLTGKQPMLPRWALGNFSSRFGYHSQQETEATISKFKDHSVPVDAIILDLYWFGKEIQGTMGNLEVFRDSFPDFEGMVSRLKGQGVKVITITEPFVLTTSKRWEEAVKEDVLAKDSIGNPYTYDFYFGNTGLIDIYKPKAEQWFWNIYKGLANMGIAGIWGDLGEPEVHPENLIHETGTADEVHNIYGHDWARLIHEGYARDFPNKRPFILMRAGYSGSQRYGLVPWSGDVNRTWGGLQSQPEIALQMGMQGLGYMHSDLGGFAGANLDDELYVRWLQYGVFQPIYRPHAQEEVPSEPVFRSHKALALAKEAIELRYKLLPYNYNLVYQNNQKGIPLMRPLFFEESDNIALYDYAETYLWGQDFLVSPILEANRQEQLVYFPKVSNWFDFYTDKKIKGGQTVSVKTNKHSIPTFVRAGAFITMAKPMQSTELYDANSLETHYYHDTSVKRSKRYIYNDDGKTANAFEKECYELLELKAEQKKAYLKIEFKAETGTKYETSIKQIELIIHNIEEAPKRIKVNGKKALGNWSVDTKILSIPVIWNTSEEKEIKIKLK
ncbi:glycoside hydrolase family 31 protein [Flavivirga amylovorans]|uniref:Glycoside hydrolase family 31 protein n=1 Tax=Flavivirga amylovorans TaxID=870486 RepID=A0ABT8WXP5_9FLAO|nr:TIM-barrel domain-containing protein [Flavivirga amylovorans]MDO5986272.1 glycoside hydrolase family 31 protein [Flavivirga amylovorans]